MRVLAIFIVTVACLWSAPGASAQVAPQEVAPKDKPITVELGKDDTPEPSTSVNISKDEEGLPQDFTIDFGDSSDWIRLVSGEWLKGNVNRMRDGVLEFDSAELKLLTLDWKKTIEFHSPAANTYVFTEGDDLVGPAMINTESVVIQTVDGMVMRPRSDLLGIIEHKARERNYWSTRLRFGFSANAGNTEQVTINAFWSLVREDSLTRAELTYDGTFGTANKVENANRHLGGGDVDIFVHPILYVKALTGQLLYDKFQNIRLRAAPAAGIGVHIITNHVGSADLSILVTTIFGFNFSFLFLRSPSHDQTERSRKRTTISS